MPNEAQPLDKGTAHTEAQIRAHTIGELKPLSGPISIVDYDPRWPVLFAREAERIRSVLGQLALQIEHIGSTSVPTLVAKPIIDILLVVTASADEAAYVPPMEAAGYTLRIREPDWHEHRMFKGPDTDLNLHVFSLGCPEIDRLLLFRDRLRSSPDDREEYAHAKLALSRQNWSYVQNYADAKSPIVEAILSGARRTAT